MQLYAPLASWGQIAVGEYRPSALRPGKSQIVGLLGAALGIERHDVEAHQALVKGYGMATCTLSPGALLRDYHTVQAPVFSKRRKSYPQTRKEELEWADSVATILSTRDYRQEGFWLVALWVRASEASYSLEELAQALHQPRFVLYLGRKSCPPALPLNPVVKEVASLKEAFDAFQPDNKLVQAFADKRHRYQQRAYAWEDPLPDGIASGFEGRIWTESRRDVPLDRIKWFFDVREEHYWSVSEEEE